jgi:hypothetical protein
MVLAPEHVIHKRDVEVELAGVFGLEFAGFQLNDDVAGLFDVEEQQVDVEVDLTADDGESGAELAQGLVIRLVRAFSRSRSATSPERPRNSKL